MAQLPLLIVCRYGSENSHADFQVRRDRILAAIRWLQQNNPCYADITIDDTNLELLPLGGIPEELLCIQESDDSDSHEHEDDNVEQDSRSFLPLPMSQPTEEAAITSNEFSTPFLATKYFPTLFPYGKGDPTNPARLRKVSLTEALKHLNKYGEFVDGSAVPVWRFASHPQFPYWGLNMKQRHQLLSQTSVYLRQHPADANLTIDDLKTMVNTMSAQQLMSRLQRYASKIQGSSQYWYQRHQELKCLLEQMGPPTFFWTVSSPVITTGQTSTGCYRIPLLLLLELKNAKLLLIAHT